jgi:periplasmic divalent cation tolerance protein
MKKYYCQLYLTCSSSKEAEVIARHLLESRLITCAKAVAASSSFHWKGKINHNDEILLIMDSREDLFLKAEKVISRLHSYQTFVLQSVRTDKVSKDAKAWMDKELK